eukprot:CAMPEP_0174852286 /NCGR_PEP_ID=MMETSP1114-20130205/25286_1 /TAXON_ID=312471 /ORGANISM="Neobodo designis, Strain CCAP 1951/1" /LENGTH=76 /DNA_ID=CAMNT_0016086869 /DNA_START=223 /DNA_END=450 /DNA_ORIENTATION=-
MRSMSRFETRTLTSRIRRSRPEPYHVELPAWYSSRDGPDHATALYFVFNAFAVPIDRLSLWSKICEAVPPADAVVE